MAGHEGYSEQPPSPSADGPKHDVRSGWGTAKEVESDPRARSRGVGDDVELTHLFARIHAWRLGAQRCARSCTRLRIPQDNAHLGRGLGALGGDLFSDLPLLLCFNLPLLPGAVLVRERAGTEVFACGGAVVIVSGGGGQVEGAGGRGGDAAGAVTEPAEEGPGAAAHKPRALGIGRGRAGRGRTCVLLGTPDCRGERVAVWRTGQGREAEAEAVARGWCGGLVVTRGRGGVWGSGGSCRLRGLGASNELPRSGPSGTGVGSTSSRARTLNVGAAVCAQEGIISCVNQHANSINKDKSIKVEKI